MTPGTMISNRLRPRLLAGLAAAAAAGSAPRLAAAAEAPDIVVLLLNDARAGDEVALPQTMQRLRDGGTTFPNFFLTTPLCCPSRATIFTGLYAHNTGVYENSSGPNGGWKAFAKRGNRGRTTGVLLQNAGYRTVAIGAYLNGAQPGKGVEPGWDVGPRASGNSGKGKRQGRSRSKARKTQPASAIAQIEETPAEQPLYLHIGFGAPHVPVRPVPPYAGQFDGVQVDRDDLSFNAPDLTGKPRFMRSLSRLKSGEEAWLDRLHQGRLECLLQLDDEIASIWDALEARGRLDNTYVFLLTDNGYLLGQHRYYGKHVPYDGSVRMPLYAFGPGFSPGAVDERLVGNVDIAPTLAEIASVELPRMDGVSLLSNHDRDAILLEFLAPAVNSMKWPGPRAEITRYRGLRTASHLYVEYQTGERELYDRGSDPSETHNLLAGAPPAEIEELAGSLSIRLAELRTCRGAVCL